MPDLPVVVIFAPSSVELQSPPTASPHETRALDCRCYPDESELDLILARDRPHIIVSFGELNEFPRLQAAPLWVRRKWLHIEPDANLETVGALVWQRFLRNLFSDLPANAPLVSVFTPTFRTGERLRRTYQSLARQEYSNWEWVVVDDSDDEGATLAILQDIGAREPRLRIHPSLRRSGIIGEVKRRACLLSRGDILVELDHDDELTPNALNDVVRAFRQFPEAGFVYSDWAEVLESGESFSYNSGWAFGYGGYREEEYSGKTLRVACAPVINPETIRHIVGCPNHLRAWRRRTYLEIGGHHPDIHVADDYELLLRTFLRTRMARIPKLCYIQYLTGGRNTTDVRRTEIQRLVHYFAAHYDRQIHERFSQLGLYDYAWNEASGGAHFPFQGVPGPRSERHCTLIAE